VNSYLKNKKEFLQSLDEQGAAQKYSTLQDIHSYLIKDKPTTFEECVYWARLKFEEFFNNQIQQLLFNFPKDLRTEQGTLFWSGSKVVPTPIIFDINDTTHYSFIVTCANLHAVNYGLKPLGEKFDYKKEITKTKLPKFKPKSGIKISASKEDEEKKDQLVDEDECQELLDSLPDPKLLVGYCLVPISFEKDDDTNHHIDFITSCSNLRARNYKIPEADRHKTKGIAGKIIPAMITTTALITGLVGFEINKVIQGKSKLEDYRNSFVNLGLPFITQSDPIKPDKGKYYETEYSIWDRIEVDLGKDITMKEFIEYFEKTLRLGITMISSGSTIIYTFYSKPDVIQKRMKMKLSNVLEEVSEKPLPPKQKFIIFEACVTDENEEDVEIPSIRYKFRF
jgi:ubiquitin-activating enzyme E1